MHACMHGPNSFLLLAGRFIFECASKPFLPTLHKGRSRTAVPTAWRRCLRAYLTPSPGSCSAATTGVSVSVAAGPSAWQSRYFECCENSTWDRPGMPPTSRAVVFRCTHTHTCCRLTCAGTFNGQGACTSVPQLPEGQSLSVSRSCVSSYPTRAAEGLLWVWPDASPAALVESAAEDAWPGLAPEVDELGDSAFSRALGSHKWYARCVCVSPIVAGLSVPHVWWQQRWWQLHPTTAACSASSGQPRLHCCMWLFFVTDL